MHTQVSNKVKAFHSKKMKVLWQGMGTYLRCRAVLSPRRLHSSLCVVWSGLGDEGGGSGSVVFGQGALSHVSLVEGSGGEVWAVLGFSLVDGSNWWGAHSD